MATLEIADTRLRGVGEGWCSQIGNPTIGAGLTACLVLLLRLGFLSGGGASARPGIPWACRLAVVSQSLHVPP